MQKCVKGKQKKDKINIFGHQYLTAKHFSIITKECSANKIK